MKVLVAQLCLILCDPRDCSPPGSSVHEILQARILEWVAIPFSRGSSWPRDWTLISCITGRFFTIWATRETKNLPAMWETWFNLWVEKGSIPVFLPGEFHGQRSLAGYSPWGHKELYTTEWLTLSTSNSGIKQAWRHYSKISWWKNCTVGSPDSVCRTARGLGLICKPNQSTNQPTNQLSSPPTHQPIINQSTKIEGCFLKQIWTLRKSHGPSSVLVPKLGHSLFYLS